MYNSAYLWYNPVVNKYKWRRHMNRRYNSIEIQYNIQITSVHSFYHIENYVMTEEPYDEEYPFWQLTFLMSGQGLYEVDSQEYPIEAGDILFRKAGRSSRITYYPEIPVSFAIISFTCNSGSLDQLPDSPTRIYGEERTTLLDLIRTGVRISRRAPLSSPFRGFVLQPDIPPAVLEFVGLSLERFLVMVQCRLTGIHLLIDESVKSNHHASLSETANAVKRYLDERIFESLRVSDVARAFGLSEVSLMKLYKREFGTSLLESFTKMKMEYAKQQIEHSSKNFTQIAEELNYSTVGYFSRVFRKHEGISPTEYSRMVSKRI